MKKICVAIALAFVLVALLGAFAEAKFGDAALHEQFASFVQRFEKSYDSPEEAERRFGIFTQNLDKIEALNAKYAGKTQFGVTKFADMTKEEIKSRYLMSDPPARSAAEKRFQVPNTDKPGFTAPSTFDWRSKPGVVTRVYDQGQCGSCWAFSATETIESQWALAGHNLTELSMQQIVDCSWWDSGCSGGWPSYAYDYVIDAPGLDPLASYPYTAEDGSCAYNQNNVVAKISSWTYTTTSSDEHQMANYLAQHGPISVCVDAEDWPNYTGGVYLASACGTSLDHCVQAVGYNLTANPPYWIIRNSWGLSWGIKGYMYLEFGKDACGVATETTSAIV